jgi:glycosyltransferase involved in cell wall biosynthesis
MKVALVHDYLNEMGGAEKVLLTLSDMWPEAPIYTALQVPGSSAAQAFAGRKIITSWFQWLPWRQRLYSPLRFLIPWIWGSFDFSKYDLVIGSASWFITKGFKKGPDTIEICYCHTPPRWLYGYDTSIVWKKYWPVKLYGMVVGHFLRMYDFNQAQKVDVFVANSKNVANRIRKFYRREAEVVYPPVEITNAQGAIEKGDYFLIVTRVVGGKGIELAVKAAEEKGFKLKIAGEQAGWSRVRNIGKRAKNVKFMGRVSEEEKTRLMAGARGFLALARDEDFGITPVESMQCGTPVIAFAGGGYKETVKDGETGILFENYSVEGLEAAIEKFNKIKWDKSKIKRRGMMFGKERFVKQIRETVGKVKMS